ncbi:flagellar hook-length control protein FliK [Aquibacillus kalidii]|uniref:flagellar hook-length control protein FliK n=1 Tax=Aquibacillus kalidii TaxID=2762597 RepID=UPI0016467D66|nr:flagellar hook-length control protein FliK [Aquibacillus kalidii]
MESVAISLPSTSNQTKTTKPVQAAKGVFQAEMKNVEKQLNQGIENKQSESTKLITEQQINDENNINSTLRKLLKVDDEGEREALLKELAEELSVEGQVVDEEVLVEQLSTLQSDINLALQSGEDLEDNLITSNMEPLNVLASLQLNYTPYKTIDLAESTIEHSNTTKLSDTISNLWTEVKQLLQQLDTENISQQDQVKILSLLEQWTKVAKSNGLKTGLEQMIPTSNADGTQDEAVWSKLLQVYQNRTGMQQKYQETATVTSKDVARWLSSALTTTSNNVSATDGSPAISNDGQIQMNNLPMSKVQQFVIHLDQTSNDSEKVQKQLLDQFQQVIKSSKFMTGLNGNQLLLKLRPENLGDIMVKLTQVNGEMIVKMTVNSQSTKELLEGNLQQLRHMFSPHQVMIEKQDLPSFAGDQQGLKQQQTNQQTKEQNSEQSNEQQDTQSSNEQETETSFHQLLMNEKV